MVCEIVRQVMSDNSNRRVAITPEAEKKPKGTKSRKPKAEGKQKKAAPEPKPVENPNAIIGTVCPLCGKGTVIKGRTAYGCSEWRSGCGWRKPFTEE